MNSLISAAIAYKRMVLTTLSLIFIFGVVAYANITKEDKPDIPIPFFNVYVMHDGISPEDSERLIIKPLEIQLRNIDGLKEMRSFGREGSASINLEFNPDIINSEALADIRAAVDDAKRDLPTDSEEPLIFEASAGRDPIIELVIFGTAPERAMTRVARLLKDEIEALGNVLEVDISGEREEVVEVIVDPSKLQVYNVTPSELLNVINSNNRLVAAGSLDTGTGKFAVKVPGLFETAKDVMDLPIKTSPSGGVVTMGDITSVRRTFKDATRFSRMHGEPAISIDVIKRPGSNVIETTETIKYILEEARKQLPQGIKVEVLFDKSDFVKDFLGTLENSVLSAVLLVVIVIVAALGFRSAFLVAVSIPGAFLFGILVLYLQGFTINTVVLFGLILSVGLLVDGAIVVTEYADRKMLEGLHKKEAYLLAAQRMAWPIISSTATTLAAFFPLLFWPGIIGKFMSFLPLTLIFVLVGSLFMALIFMPTLGTLVGRPGEADENLMWQLAGDHEMDTKKLTGFTGFYIKILEGLVKHPLRVIGTIATSIFLLFMVWNIYASQNRPTEFFPNGSPESSRLYVHARGNLSPVDMDRLVGEVEVRVKDIDGIKSIYSRAGTRMGGGQRASDIIGRITIIFEDWDKRREADGIIQDIRDATSDLSGIFVEPELPSNGPQRGKKIQIKLASENPKLMNEAGNALRIHMENMPGLIDIDDSNSAPGIQWMLEVDRSEAARYGTDIVTIGSVIQLVTNGIKMGEVRFDDAIDEMDIRVRYPKEFRGITELDNLMVPTAKGNIPISNFVKRVAKDNISELRRVDNQRVMEIRSNVGEGEFASEKVDEIKSWIKAQNFDSQVEVIFGGSDQDERESQDFLAQAFMAALFIMAIILITQFNSFYHAFLILTAVVMSTMGVALGLMITGNPFIVVMTGVGVIALAGIVVNNNIVLIDTYTHLVSNGIEPIEAIIRTGAQRLRPVMLTTFTTIIGLMPMALQFNVDFFARNVEIGAPSSIMWVPLAQAIVFGLAVATLLTLVLTPAFLALPVHIRTWWTKRKLKRLINPQTKAAE